MTERFDFEPEIVFPSSPVDAARVFLGAMAYPEIGSGLPGGHGSAFAHSMWARMVWSRRKAVGLAAIRRELGDPTFKPPELREFEGIYVRGQRRLRRRAVAYSVVGTQMLQTFFRVRADASKLAAENRHCEAFVTVGNGKYGPAKPEIWKRNARSPYNVIVSNVENWAKRLALNETGASADSNQKAKDLVRRAYLQSRPVLHMAHAFSQACDEIGPTCPGWGEGDFTLIMLINSKRWIFSAIENAIRWQEMSMHHSIPDLQPEHMIQLISGKPAT